MLEENSAEDSAANTGLPVVSGTYNDETIRFVARRLVVQLAAPDEQQDAAARMAGALAALPAGTTVIRGPSPTGRLVVLLPANDSGANETADVVLANVAIAGTTPAIDWAEPDVVDTAQIVPNDPRYPQQWAPGAVNAEAAWDLQTGAAGVLIGIVDSGISMTADVLDHDDLNDAARFTLGTDFIDGGTPRDLNGHGTHVVGIAAATGDNGAGIAGMNWGSPVYICRTFDADNQGSGADFADAVEEITDYAVAHGLRAVVNYSGGGPASTAKQQACQYASDHGMLVVAATGNDNAGPVLFPAAYSTSITGVVAVGSTDQGDVVSSYSNVGPEVTVVAPGRNILSTLPTYTVKPTLPLNYGTLSGTSMATPLVTGLAALLWSRHPSHTNAKVKQCLQDSAVKLGSGTFDNSWGSGRVDAHAALTCGDLVIPRSSIVVCPPPKSSLCPSVLRCPSTISLCAPPQTSLCPSVLRCPSTIELCPPPRTALCPSVLQCPSRLPVLCQSSLRCPSVLRCPSAIDACPSSLGCDTSALCDPQQPIDPAVDPAVLGRLADLQRRVESGAEGAAGSGAGWFYIDDDGTVHEV